MPRIHEVARPATMTVALRLLADQFEKVLGLSDSGVDAKEIINHFQNAPDRDERVVAAMDCAGLAKGIANRLMGTANKLDALTRHRGVAAVVARRDDDTSPFPVAVAVTVPTTPEGMMKAYMEWHEEYARNPTEFDDIERMAGDPARAAALAENCARYYVLAALLMQYMAAGASATSRNLRNMGVEVFAWSEDGAPLVIPQGIHSLNLGALGFDDDDDDDHGGNGDDDDDGPRYPTNPPAVVEEETPEPALRD